jgi:phosphoribosylaminoimidazole (AIR) synthetase
MTTKSKAQLYHEARNLYHAKCLLYQGWEEAITGTTHVTTTGLVESMSRALRYITKQADAAMSRYNNAIEDRAEYLR